MDIFELTEKQKKAFNRLKRAYKDCEKHGIFFFNCYGSLTAVNSELIQGYGDESSLMHSTPVDTVSTYEGSPLNYIKIPNEWADDEHMYHLTKKGKKINDADY
jgi:hypothetical protein